MTVQAEEFGKSVWRYESLGCLKAAAEKANLQVVGVTSLFQHEGSKLQHSL